MWKIKPGGGNTTDWLNREEGGQGDEPVPTSIISSCVKYVNLVPGHFSKVHTFWGTGL